MTNDTIVRFPNSKRCLTSDEERLVKSTTNIIHNSYQHTNPFVKQNDKTSFVELQIKTLLRKVFEINEDINEDIQ
jgi:hypothetical protein